MTAYGHELEFGYLLVTEAGDEYAALDALPVADRLGYDVLAVQDHPYQPAQLDALALLGVILARTERIRVFQDVCNLSLRPRSRRPRRCPTCSAAGGSQAGREPAAFWTQPRRWVRRPGPRDRASRRSRRRS
jgi:hypothetical protein